MKRRIIDKAFRAATLAQIEQANRIITEYQRQGFTLTLRQLFYQFVSRELLPNTSKAYDKLGRTINDARMAGLVDWDAIEDRTRNLHAWENWNSGADLLADAVGWFRTDKWADQERYVEVWIEKDALVGVIEGVCRELEVPFFACRGYPSLSELWSAAQRFTGRYYAEDGGMFRETGQYPLVIHLGDHDPRGLDMTRDVRDRLHLLTGLPIDIERIALNRDQIEEHSLPPNVAKLTDSMAAAYVAEHGPVSWELDALEPQTISELVRGRVLHHRDQDVWEVSAEREKQIRARLNLTMDNFQREGV